MKSKADPAWAYAVRKGHKGWLNHFKNFWWKKETTWPDQMGTVDLLILELALKYKVTVEFDHKETGKNRGAMAGRDIWLGEFDSKSAKVAAFLHEVGHTLLKHDPKRLQWLGGTMWAEQEAWRIARDEAWRWRIAISDEIWAWGAVQSLTYALHIENEMGLAEPKARVKMHKKLRKLSKFFITTKFKEGLRGKVIKESSPNRTITV